MGEFRYFTQFLGENFPHILLLFLIGTVYGLISWAGSRRPKSLPTERRPVSAAQDALVIEKTVAADRGAGFQPLALAGAIGWLPRWARLAISAFVGWSAAVLLFVWAFEPFGRHLYDREWNIVAKVIVFPCVLAVIVWALYSWAARK